MMTYQLSSAFFGSLLGLTILFLVRRDHIQLSHGLFWLAFALASIVFGVAPGFSDYIARFFGISYGPTLVLLAAVAALIIRCLQADMRATRLERNLRRLTQRIALLEADISSKDW
ncbi:MAG: DUF2304 domain-containing protein [Methylococcus sp.]|nr:DUF2304 domain-containing protein [Methylococcus sp.]